MKKDKQLLPIVLTVLTCLCLIGLLVICMAGLNAFPVKERVKIILLPLDILVGMTIYLKTSVDFALFMGNLMSSNPGWKKRIAIEIGTALGNAFGTIVVLIIWFFFKEAPLLMVLMILVASLILLQMAQEGLEEFLEKKWLNPLVKILRPLYKALMALNSIFRPLLGKIIPSSTIMHTKTISFWNLLFFSFTIPFILGLDDFAGYIPLFTIINVFSFIAGVFLAHMILNIGLFAFPKKTIQITHHPVIVLVGSFAFIIIALFGLYDVVEIINHLLR